ncbi:glutamate--cysteine ligase [Temperatibacter marinus]|uniref:Glutamate--cysteine ligase n=1 Tax=Temperatibacter marinus TaxID=1456591 RepID=A0AA52EJE5_9PROT|nr:glutamate--cysteine ligase [Temperatibacter marinus]WND03131.1 glutamate--cysteine ligase [Temperatibacter marinus]
MADTTIIDSKDVMMAYLESGSKPDRDSWRIGAEHEKFVFHRSDNRPLSYAGENGRPGIRDVLKAFEDFGWKPVSESGNVIAEISGGASITLEPGGQFELSGAPLEHMHDICTETSRHLQHAKEIGEKLDVGFLGLGFHPTSSRECIPVMPKARYGIMRNYMPKVGSLGLDMMMRTCTVQVNLDFESEADMIEKFRIGLALQPIATALFANSPFLDGRNVGYQSYRSHIWTDTDSDRCGLLPFVFEDGMSFERYLDHVLDVPMYFVRRGGDYIDAAGQSFRDFMDGKLPALPGELPTMEDFQDHMTTLFPEVRLKTFLEMRGADGGPWNRLCALPAFWVGLLYSKDSQQACLDLIKPWTFEELETMRHSAPKLGLKTAHKGRLLRDVAKEVLDIADAGLKERAKLSTSGENESGFISSLYETVETGKTPADKMIDAMEDHWDGDVSHVFKEFSY